nr:uncharacterized protein C2orf50 homolog isoform X1 [Paramormyrops kingsleyae]
MDSRKASARRAASAGYRFPDPAAAAAAALTSHSSGPPFRQPAAKVRLGRTGEAPTRDPDFRDPVKQDQVWREFVRAERDGAKEWQKNWSFLRNYDQLVRVAPGRRHPSPAMSQCSQTSSPTRPTRRSEAAWGLTWDRPWSAWTTWQCCAGVTERPSWTRTCSPARSGPKPSSPQNHSTAWRAAGLQGIAEQFTDPKAVKHFA